MCGIVGVWGHLAEPENVIRQACRRLHHRGPDSQGYWHDPNAELALGHVRLAILDLTQAGHQPMVSACDRYVIVLNGEIYNHLDLRAKLQAQGHAPNWRGHSDTETVLAAFAAWGVAQTLQAMVGMFAIALWDRQDQVLTLMRDRLGEKPLYVGFVQDKLAFASELRALEGLPGFRADLNAQALALLLRHNYIPGPHSIYADFQKLPAGTFMTIGRRQLSLRQLPPSESYWSVAQQARLVEQAGLLQFDNDDQAIQSLHTCLSQAVQGQMLSDVPLGAFLSGGVDSSLIAALMQAGSATPVNTFSIGFDEPSFDEAPYARQVARHLGTQHNELYVNAADALNLVPDLAGLYDEPFADASQIPTLLVTRMARRHVTVALSGDGGDELFCGYSRYFRARQWWARHERIPAAVRPLAHMALHAAAHVVPGVHRREQLQRLANRLGAANVGRFYLSFVSYWPEKAGLLSHDGWPPTPFDEQGYGPLMAQMPALDLQTYLPDDILVKLDRAAMASSLETRVPLLDHRVVEFALRLPLSYKVRQGQGKWLLRQLLYRHVPAHLIDRPKKGFSVPLAAWLRGPLRDWAHSLLDPAVLQQQGIVDASAVQSKWREHQAGHDWSTHLWGILMLQAWLAEKKLGAPRVR
jgi:asparagine synthase (glutamine-hydrolysing)